MVEIQCSSCHTRYRIDERVLPEDTPTFKCSRCGHVFTIEPRGGKRPDPKPVIRKAPEAKATLSKSVDPKFEGPGSSESQAAETKPAFQGTADDSAISASAVEPKARRSLKIASPLSPKRESGLRASDSKGAAPPQVQPGLPAAQLSHDDPLTRPFPDHAEEAQASEDMSFDFTAEGDERLAEPKQEPGAQAWDVDESGLDFGDPDDRGGRASDGTSKRAGSRRKERDDEIAEQSMLSLGRPIHSSGLFLAWFFFVALAFGGLSLLMAGEPIASASLMARLPHLGGRFFDPASPAVQVALRGVRAQYRVLGGQGTVLVITGEALNVSNQALHEIQIAVSLLDGGQQQLARQAVFCGNRLSDRMMNQMTPRELDFFQKLGPPKGFVLQPSGSFGFSIVFIDPPAGAGKFAIDVERAASINDSDIATVTSAS